VLGATEIEGARSSAQARLG